MPLPDVTKNEPLSRHTSLKVGGPAERFAQARCADEMVALLQWAVSNGLVPRMIGGGSNLLVADAGVDGLVVKAVGAAFRVEDRGEETILVAEAGATFANVARRLAKQGVGGLEWASNVPGTIGGAVVNNAGAFGGETSRDLVAATIVDAGGATSRLLVDELGYAYRTSVLKRRELGEVFVLEAELRVRRTSPEASQELVATYQAQRTRSQPRQLSAGSVFANPPGTFSGKLIEEAGLKGLRIGGAEVSRQHANFIVNAGGATGSDVYSLVRKIQDTVVLQNGVWLHTEIELFGRWSAQDRAALRSPEGSQHA